MNLALAAQMGSKETYPRFDDASPTPVQHRMDAWLRRGNLRQPTTRPVACQAARGTATSMGQPAWTQDDYNIYDWKRCYPVAFHTRAKLQPDHLGWRVMLQLAPALLIHNT